MPGIDEKVILGVKLELDEISKGLGKLGDAVQKVSVKSLRSSKEQAKLSKTRIAGLDKEKKSIEKIAAAWRASAAAQQTVTKELTKQNVLAEKLARVVGRIKGSSAYKNMNVGRDAGRATKRVGLGLGGMALGVGAATLGFIAGGVRQSFGSYLQYGQSQRGITGTGMSRGALARARRAGVGMGYGATETAGMAPAAMHATGAQGAITSAQKFAIAGGGMSLGQSIGVMGQLRQVGVEGGSPEGDKKLAKIIASGTSTGMKDARLPEYLQTVASMAGMVGQRQAGNVDVSRTIGASFGLLSRMRGMKGNSQRMGGLAQRLDQSIRQPGGGEAGQALTLRAFGFGTPEGNSGLYEATKRQQAGYLGEGGTTNLIDLVKRTEMESGGPVGSRAKGGSEQANWMLNKVTGLEFSLIEEIGDVVAELGEGKEAQDKIKGILGKHKSIGERTLTALDKGFSGISRYQAQLEDRRIRIGEKWNKPLMQLQQFQLKLLEDLAGGDLAGKMQKMVDLLGEIWGAIKYFLKDTPFAIGKNKKQSIGEQIKSIGTGGAKSLGALHQDIAGLRDSQTAPGWKEKLRLAKHRVAKFAAKGPMSGISRADAAEAKEITEIPGKILQMNQRSAYLNRYGRFKGVDVRNAKIPASAMADYRTALNSPGTGPGSRSQEVEGMGTTLIDDKIRAAITRIMEAMTKSAADEAAKKKRQDAASPGALEAVVKGARRITLKVLDKEVPPKLGENGG